MLLSLLKQHEYRRGTLKTSENICLDVTNLNVAPPPQKKKLPADKGDIWRARVSLYILCTPLVLQCSLMTSTLHACMQSTWHINTFVYSHFGRKDGGWRRVRWKTRDPFGMRNKIYPIPILDLAFFDKHLECLIKLLYEVASESAVDPGRKNSLFKTHYYRKLCAWAVKRIKIISWLSATTYIR